MDLFNFTKVSEGSVNGTSSSSSRTELLVFALYKMVLSPVTVIGNGLLVVTGLIDPLRSFRSPTSVLLLTMLAANVLTGIAVEPIFAALEYNTFFGRKSSLKIANLGSSLSLLSFNISYGMVFALAFNNFIAVFRPTKYRACITMQRVKICIAIISLIALAFAILPHLNIPIDTVLKADLYVNSTLNSVLLIVSYVLLYIAFQNQAKKSSRLRNGNKNVGKLSELQNKFRRVLIIFSVFSTMPAILSTIAYYFENYCGPCQKYKAFVIVKGVCLNLLFIKCAIDPFVFGWRLSRNRQALKKILCCQLRNVRRIGITGYPDNLQRVPNVKKHESGIKRGKTCNRFQAWENQESVPSPGKPAIGVKHKETCNQC